MSSAAVCRCLIEAHGGPFHSIPFHSLHSIAFDSIPFQVQINGYYGSPFPSPGSTGPLCRQKRIPQHRKYLRMHQPRPPIQREHRGHDLFATRQCCQKALHCRLPAEARTDHDARTRRGHRERVYGLGCLTIVCEVEPWTKPRPSFPRPGPKRR